MSRFVTLLLAVALLAPGAAAMAGRAPPDPAGGWDGSVVQSVRVRRMRPDRSDATLSVSLSDGAWRSRDGEGRYEGVYEARRRRHVLTYDVASADALADEVATRIEERAAADGRTVEATVTFTRMRATARARTPRRRGLRLVVRERHAFTLTITGDESVTRRGVLRTRAVLEPGPGVPPPQRVSSYEVDPPYLTGDPEAFWARADLYVMQPDLLPADRWPDEVLFPTDHGIKVIVLLPGDYRERSNGRLGPGVLYIEDSGTAAEPILVTFAPHVGADLRETPHAAERFGQSEARLTALRIFNQGHQYFRGLTFSDGISACLLHTASDNVIDCCLWHETAPQPLRIRFNSHRNLVQRCVIRRFDKDLWGSGDTVAINLSDEALTHNRIVSNVILNYTDSYQHTDRDGDEYGLGAGTIIDNNFMGFTADAYVDTPDGELMCGENSIDLKMGGTAEEPIRISDNVFFGVRAAQAGCAASGSGGYAITFQRRGTWIEMTDNLFVDMDSGIFLNTVFLNVDAAQGRIDPHWTFTGNTFSGIRSFATAFPTRTGRVLSGLSPATFTGNRIVACERLMEQEPFPGPWELVIEDNDLYGALELAPRDAARLEADGNVFQGADAAFDARLDVPWSDLTLEYRAAR